MTVAERGIVIGCSHQVEFRSYRVYDPETRGPGREEHQWAFITPMPQLIEPAIRRSILYFDRIDLPRDRIGLPPPYDEMHSSLEDQGIVQCTAMETPNENNDAMGAAHVEVFIQHETQQPGAWTFAPLVPALDWGVSQYPERSRIPSARGLELQLLNALPIPGPNVPYADILEFKDRRRAELLALRTFLDEVYLGVAQSNDIPRAQLAATAKVEKALEDVKSALDASGIRAVLQALRVDLLMQVTGGARFGAWAAHELHQNATYGAVIGGVHAAYRYIRKNVPKPISRCGALAYLGHAAQEGVVNLPTQSQRP